MDIFGRNPSDYQHIQAMMRLGVWDDHTRALAERGMPHDFEALGNAERAGFRPFNDYDSLNMTQRAEANAQAASYLTNNLQAIVSMFQEVVYLGGRRVYDFIPMRMDIADGADSYLHRVVDKFGEGEFITTDGTDAPSALASMRPVTVPLGYAGIVGKWTVEDLRKAMFGGFPLDSQVMEAASMGALTHIAKVAFVGHPTRFQAQGLTKGLTNQPTAGAGAVTATTAAQTFDAGTAEQNIATIRDAIGRIIVNSLETYPTQIGGDLVVALPTAQFNYITTVRYGEGSDMTADRWISMNNPWTRRGGGQVMFMSLPELDSANNDDLTQDRMVVYVKNVNVVEMAQAIAPRVLSIEDKGYVICANFEYKFGPLFPGRPDGMQYVNNI